MRPSVLMDSWSSGCYVTGVTWLLAEVTSGAVLEELSLETHTLGSIGSEPQCRERLVGAVR